MRFSCWKSKYETEAPEEVKRIMVADVAEVTGAYTFISSIKGPFTIPPPTPNIPAARPAVEQMRG